MNPVVGRMDPKGHFMYKKLQKEGSAQTGSWWVLLLLDEVEEGEEEDHAAVEHGLSVFVWRGLRACVVSFGNVGDLNGSSVPVAHVGTKLHQGHSILIQPTYALSFPPRSNHRKH